MVNPITVGDLAFLFNCTPGVARQTLWRFRLKDLSIDELVGAWCFGCCQAHQGLPDGFLLLQYSVLFAVESLSLLYLLFISWFIYFRRWCIDKLVREISCKPNIRYSVLFNVESLSLLYLLFISWFICSRRWCIDKWRIVHANQTSMCLEPHLN